MAIGIENFPNIIPADADYLNGDIKDTPSGTPVNREVYGDIHQFFRKIMRVAGISPNNLRDNETNGFQLFQSLQISARPYLVYSALLSQTGTNDPTIESSDADGNANEPLENSLPQGAIVWARTGVGIYTGTLVGAFPADKTFVTITSTGTLLFSLTRLSDDGFNMNTKDSTGVLSDGLLLAATVQIRVYR